MKVRVLAGVMVAMGLVGIPAITESNLASAALTCSAELVAFPGACLAMNPFAFEWADNISPLSSASRALPPTGHPMTMLAAFGGRVHGIRGSSTG